MAHRRDEIKALIVSTLTGQTDAQDRVLNSHFKPIQDESLFPCINIFCVDETGSEHTSGSELYERRATVQIDALTLKDIGDGFLRQIEVAMNRITHPDFSFFYRKFDIGVNATMTKTSFINSLSYECIYYTEEVSPANGDPLLNLSIEVKNG